MNNKEIISNITIDKENNNIFVSINPKVYPLEIIYCASYVFLDKAYLLIDENAEKKIIVELKPKEKYDLEKLGREFNNELLNYATYATISKKNQEIRNTLLQRALLTNEGEDVTLQDNLTNEEDMIKEVEELLEEGLEEDKEFLKEIEDTEIPWEKKDKDMSSNKKNKKQKEKFKINYKEKNVEVFKGEKILDACEELGVSFGCRDGQCGTCEIEVVGGFQNLSEVNDKEKVLGADKYKRFACQCKLIKGDVKIDY